MRLKEIDIQGLSYRELNELKESIGTRMDELQAQGLPALKEPFAEEAPALGVTLEEIVCATKGRRGRPRKRRPEEATRTTI
jgi:hypothetical protein